MSPMPETRNANQRASFHSVKEFLEASIGDYAMLDSIFPKDPRDLERLLGLLNIQALDNLPLIEASYTTQSHKIEHRVFSVPTYPGVFITQERKNSNGRGFARKPWGKTILRKLGTKATHDYLKSIGVEPTPQVL